MRAALPLSLAFVLTAITAFAGDKKPSVSTVTPIGGEKTKGATISRVEMKAHCVSCVQDVAGTLTLAGSGIQFCCATVTGSLEAGSKVRAKCPYSFTLDPADVREQYAEPGVWHIVTKSGEHYAFASSEQKSIDNAFAALQKIAVEMQKSTLLDNADAAAFLAKLKKPQLAVTGSCP